MKQALCILALSLLTLGCQTTNTVDGKANPDCVQRKVGSKVLARVTGIGLGVAGVPGGGLIARGVSIATDPRCEAVIRPQPASAAVQGT